MDDSPEASGAEDPKGSLGGDYGPQAASPGSAAGSADVASEYEDVSGELDELLANLALAPNVSDATSAKQKQARQRFMQRSRFVLPARTAAVAASFVAIASLTALAIVADSHDANALSTIALALAILAFVVQIMVFIYQSQTSHQQMLQGEQLYTETRALLTEVRTAANSTETLVREQFRDLLKAFMDAAPSSSEGDGIDSDAFEKKLLAGLRREMVSASPPRPPIVDRATSSVSNRVQENRNKRARDARAIFRSFPEEDEGRPALEKLTQLSVPARERLTALANDEIDSRASGTYLGLEPEDLDLDLFSKGLASKARVRVGDDDFQIVTRLSDQGKPVARLLTGIGDVPDYASEFLE